MTELHDDLHTHPPTTPLPVVVEGHGRPQVSRRRHHGRGNAGEKVIVGARPIGARGREETGSGRAHVVTVRGRQAVGVVVVGVLVGGVGEELLLELPLEGRGVSVGLQDLRQPHEVELVGVALAVHLGHDVLVVVVAQRTAQLVVVHVGFGLPLAPAARHLIRVHQLELAVRALPRDAARVGRVRQQLQQELPQLDLTRPCNGQSSRQYSGVTGHGTFGYGINRNYNTSLLRDMGHVDTASM